MCVLPPFYKGLFKVWTLFKWARVGPAASLFWLLEEPLVWGARLDVQDSSRPALSERLRSVGVVKLRNIVDAAGPGLHNTEAVASLLGLKSARHTRTILNEWTKRLTDDEMEMLREYSNRKETPDEGDPFPDIGILADQDGLEPRTHSDLQMQNGKGFYRLCTLALNKQKLSERRDTVWKQRLNVPGGCEPVWRLFYKPPLNKRSGDLQWRILHGALGVNAFVSKINPTVSSECPFCTDRETITHCYLDCHRLKPLFNVLKTVFLDCGEVFTETAFIFGAGYKKQNAGKWELLNFIVGQAKISIYKSRKNKVNSTAGQQLTNMFLSLVKSESRF